MFGTNEPSKMNTATTWLGRIRSFWGLQPKPSKQATNSNANIEPPILSKVLIDQQFDPRSEALQALPIDLSVTHDLFYNRPTLFYYEAADESLLNTVIKENYKAIRDNLSSKNIDFIFPNMLSNTSEHAYVEMVHYYYPSFDLSEVSSSSILEHLANSDTLRALMGFETLHQPCFIRAIPDKHLGRCVYKTYYLPTENETLIEESIAFYLRSIPKPIPQYVQASAGGRNLENDPDEAFLIDSDRISFHLRYEIEQELKHDPSKGMLRTMLFLLQKMQEINAPSVPALQQFIRTLHQDTIFTPSRVKINANGDVFLIDYKKEVTLTPLQKAVFIFFLSKPHGIYFKNLPNYKNELLHIYSKISARSSMEQIEKSVMDLINPYSNSMSEKCSRIKEAFIKCVDERVAHHYYVSGNRNSSKRISLDRSLVLFEEPFY